MGELFNTWNIWYKTISIFNFTFSQKNHKYLSRNWTIYKLKQKNLQSIFQYFYKCALLKKENYIIKTKYVIFDYWDSLIYFKRCSFFYALISKIFLTRNFWAKRNILILQLVSFTQLKKFLIFQTKIRNKLCNQYNFCEKNFSFKKSN